MSKASRPMASSPSSSTRDHSYASLDARGLRRPGGGAGGSGAEGVGSMLHTPTLRNQMQETALSAQLARGMRFLVCKFAV
eukprot:1703625-Rhodomonas_salina.2